MTQAESELLTRIEQGTTLFRPEETCPAVDTSFTAVFDRLMPVGFPRRPPYELDDGPCDSTRRRRHSGPPLGPSPFLLTLMMKEVGAVFTRTPAMLLIRQA